VGGVTLHPVASEDSQGPISTVEENKAAATKVTEKDGQVEMRDNEKQEPTHQVFTSPDEIDGSSYASTWGITKQSDHDKDLRAWQQINVRKTTTHTSEMRKATGPNNPPGGSKLVRGREPTVVGQANMMSSFAHDGRDEAVPPSAPLPGTSSSTSCAAPSDNTGFFDEEYSHGKRTGSPPTTGRTNQSEVLGKRTN
jgi:hypothetical protein